MVVETTINLETQKGNQRNRETTTATAAATVTTSGNNNCYNILCTCVCYLEK